MSEIAFPEKARSVSHSNGSVRRFPFVVKAETHGAPYRPFLIVRFAPNPARRPGAPPSYALSILQLRKHDSLLGLILSLAVGVAGFADFVGLEKDDLAEPFVGVDSRGQRGRI